MVHWIDTKTNENFANTLVGARPRAAMFTNDGKFLWVSSEIGGTVAILDVSTQQITKEFTFSISGIHKDRVQPVGIELSEDGRYAFIALGPANHVAVIDREKMKVDKYLLVGRRVWQLAFNHDESQLLTTNGISGDVSLIDVDSMKVKKSIKVGRYPWGVTIRQVP